MPAVPKGRTLIRVADPTGRFAAVIALGRPPKLRHASHSFQCDHARHPVGSVRLCALCDHAPTHDRRGTYLGAGARSDQLFASGSDASTLGRSIYDDVTGTTAICHFRFELSAQKASGCRAKRPLPEFPRLELVELATALSTAPILRWIARLGRHTHRDRRQPDNRSHTSLILPHRTQRRPGRCTDGLSRRPMVVDDYAVIGGQVESAIKRE